MKHILNIRSKFVTAIFLASIILVIGLFIGSIVKKQRQKDLYNKAFIRLFVTERNEVLLLYEAIDSLIASPDKEHYDKALSVAVKTEEVCCGTYMELSRLTPTYGAELVYYATFYRDIKYALKSRNTEILNHIHNLLNDIIKLYDDSSNPENYSNEFEAMGRFYKSLSLLNEEMMQLC